MIVLVESVVMEVRMLGTIVKALRAVGVAVEACMRFVLLAFAVGVMGCQHIDHNVPGVLDLRSDGSAVATQTTAIDPKLKRDGTDAITGNDGLTGTPDGKFRLDERRVWVIGLIPIMDSTNDELKDALPPGTGARQVVISEEITTIEVVAKVCGSYIPVVSFAAALLLPTMSTAVAGQRIQLGVGQAAPPPPPAAMPAAMPAPPATLAPSPAPAPPTPPAVKPVVGGAQ
jgi:hypothetical protein